MKEEEWKSCPDPDRILDLCLPNASNRKLRLFACACCRPIWHLLTDSSSREAVEIAELFSDDKPVEITLYEAESNSIDAWDGKSGDVAWAFSAATHVAAADAGVAAVWTARCVAGYHADDEWRAAVDNSNFPGRPNEPWAIQEPLRESKAWVVRRDQASLLRHVLGNPFQPYSAPPSLPSLILDLAQQLYDGTDTRLVLHDALLDSGHQELAEHFANEHWHPKGCWAMDVILGKS